MMDSLLGIVAKHPAVVVILGAAWWIFSAAVSALPMPEQNDPKWYKFLFAFAHSLAGSLARAWSVTELGELKPRQNGK